MKKLLLIILCLSATPVVFSQWCYNNPSMEGTSQAHVVPAPWQACYGSPDTQPGQWGITLPASDGNTYVSFLHAGNSQNGYQEGMTQLLTPPLTAGQEYVFTVDLAHSDVYNTAEPQGCYSALIVYGGNAQCSKTETLWTSGKFYHTNWQEYTINFTPSGDWTYIAFAAYHDGTNCTGYINLLMDNISCITEASGGAVGTNADCFEACNGTAVMTVNSGTPPYTYEWSTGATTDSIGDLCAGTYYVTVTDSLNQTVIDTVEITEPAPITTAMSSLVTCEDSCNGTGVATNTSGGYAPYTYLWSNNDNTDTANGLCVGEHYVTITDSVGCQIIDTVTVDESVLLLELGPDRDKCTEESLELDAGNGGGVNYLWSSGETTQTNYIGTPGTYWVQIDDGGYCYKSDTITITKAETPFAQIGVIKGICRDVTLDATKKEGITYLWNTGATTHAINTNEDGQYTVEINNGRCSNTDTIDLEIEYIEPPTLIPNVFTPNNDGQNDELKFLLPLVESYDLKVYNRWGTLMFESTDPNKNWNGSDAPQGIYNYILVYKKLCGTQETVTEKGYVTLLR